MSIAFDLISDLHLETWDEKFNWVGQPTSPVCVIAGDIATDPRLVKEALKHLANQYAAVFYIDGNDEHRYQLHNLGQSYKMLNRAIGKLPRVTYLQDNVVVIDGVAIVGTNGWWGFDFDLTIGSDESQVAMKQRYESQVPEVPVDTHSIINMARGDAAYLLQSIQRLQTHGDIKKIVIVTHSVPRPELIDHDISLMHTPRFNTMGNRLMSLVTTQDTEKKIDTWCFGHYHAPVDRIINGVRYVNNCKGRGNTDFHTSVYYPKRIEIET